MNLVGRLVLKGAALLVLLIAFPVEAVPSSRNGADEGAALILDKGSLIRHEMVAIGRDVHVNGDALSHVAALDGSIIVRGKVEGDIIVLGGDAELLPGARVKGNAFVLGGSLKVAEDAAILGRSVSYPTVSEAWLTLLEGPSLGLDPLSPVVLATKVGLLAAWLLLAMILLLTAGRELVNTSESILKEPLRNFATGLTAVLLIFLVALAMGAFLQTIVGFPIVSLLIMFAFLLKFWGLSAVFYSVGSLVMRLRKRRVLPLTTLSIGVILVGGCKFIPLVGLWAWWIASFIGIGAALSTKFGRSKPWLQGDSMVELDDLRKALSS